MMGKYTLCPGCYAVIDSTIKKNALANTETGYREEITVECPTCGAKILVKLEWSPVVISAETVKDSDEPYLARYDWAGDMRR